MDRWLDSISSYKQGFHLSSMSANGNVKEYFSRLWKNGVIWLVFAARWCSWVHALIWALITVCVELPLSALVSSPPNMLAGGLALLNCPWIYKYVHGRVSCKSLAFHLGCVYGIGFKLSVKIKMFHKCMMEFKWMSHSWSYIFKNNVKAGKLTMQSFWLLYIYIISMWAAGFHSKHAGVSPVFTCLISSSWAPINHQVCLLFGWNESHQQHQPFANKIPVLYHVLSIISAVMKNW